MQHAAAAEEWLVLLLTHYLVCHCNVEVVSDVCPVQQELQYFLVSSQSGNVQCCIAIL